MSSPYRVALLGFSAFERNALASYFRLATNREPRYEAVRVVSEADLMVADADHTPSVDLVAAIERLDDTVFVGARLPSQARVCLNRPLEPAAVMRELDTLLEARGAQAPRAPDPGRPRRLPVSPSRTSPPPTAGEDLPPLELELRSEPAPIRSPAPPPSATPGSPAIRPARPGPLATALTSFPSATPPEFPPIVPPIAPPIVTANASPNTQSNTPAIYPPLAPTVMEAAAEPDGGAIAQAMRTGSGPTGLRIAAETREPGTGSTPTPSAAPAGPPPPLRAAPPASSAVAPTPAATSQLAMPAQSPAHPAGAGVAPPARATSAAGNAAAVKAPHAVPRPPSTVASRPAAAKRAVTPAIRALVVDDSEIAQRFLQLRLEQFGLLIDCATSSEVALSLLTRHSYDFAFLDVELGESSRMDGLALCQAIKRHYATRVPPITVVLVTAHMGELDRVRGTLAGCDAFLGKPLDEAALDRLLARQGLVRQPPAQPA